MPDQFISRPPNLALVATAIGSLVLSLALALWTPLRESAVIILFIPLIWAYMRLSKRGIVVATILAIAARGAAEAVQHWAREQAVVWGHVAYEAVFPSALYVALAVAFYLYRRALSRMVTRLARARSLEAIQHLTGSLAHDFGNLMQVVVGVAQLLHRKDNLDAEAREEVRDILDAGQQACELLAEMRDFSRRSTRMGVHDLSRLAERQVRLIHRAMPKNIELTCKPCSQPLPVWADDAQVGRLLTNLCTNARNAMPDGGLLTVRTMPAEHEGKPVALLAISDTGSGIDPRRMKHIFDPFFSWQRSEEGQGLGLGLSIVRSIVQEHDGWLDVESSPGKGATFFIYLPLHQGDLSAPAVAPADADGR